MPKVGFKHSKETRSQMSASHLGKPKPWLQGKKLSSSHKRNIGLSLKDKPKSELHISRIAASNSTRKQRGVATGGAKPRSFEQSCVVIDARLATNYVVQTNGCWKWLGPYDKDGYGKVTFKKKQTSAHRVAWERFYGNLTKNIKVLHSCDNPSCINLSHLFLGTSRDNSQDMVSKHRQATGEKIGIAKLTNAEAREIRNRYQPRSLTNGQKALAKEFSVSVDVISGVVRGKTYPSAV